MMKYNEFETILSQIQEYAKCGLVHNGNDHTLSVIWAQRIKDFVNTQKNKRLTYEYFLNVKYVNPKNQVQYIEATGPVFSRKACHDLCSAFLKKRNVIGVKVDRKELKN